MIPGVHVEHEIHERPNQPRSEPAKHDESRTADLGAALKVDEAETGADFPMRLNARTFTRRSPAPDDGVVLFSAGRYLVERDVGQLEENR